MLTYIEVNFDVVAHFVITLGHYVMQLTSVYLFEILIGHLCIRE